jgi:hypothetical protein
MLDDKALKKILSEERTRYHAEAAVNQLAFKQKYGTFNTEEMAILSAMRLCFTFGANS